MGGTVCFMAKCLIYLKMRFLAVFINLYNETTIDFLLGIVLVYFFKVCTERWIGSQLNRFKEVGLKWCLTTSGYDQIWICFMLV